MNFDMEIHQNLTDKEVESLVEFLIGGGKNAVLGEQEGQERAEIIQELNMAKEAMQKAAAKIRDYLASNPNRRQYMTWLLGEYLTQVDIAYKSLRQG